FWPGPLTLVLARRAEVPALVSAGLPTVAVRSPAHPVARALIAAAGVPIAAPSANRSNAVSPTTAAHVLRSLGGRVPLVLDAGPCAVGLESTVLDLTGDVPRVLRPGHVTAREIADELAEPVAQAAIVVASDVEARVSPGTSARHYAPRARVEVVPRAWLAWRVRDLRDRGLAFRVIARGALPEGTEGRAIGEEPADFARGLYAALHALDEEGVERIVVEAPPRGDERWAAVRDRLARAASDGEGGAGA
ncbi:MAG: L-threonylcarbamoyladenylate synthase, partial [Deltaproteobacteria bacterium]|nr:L-threonylcarbamoyladenylate synthase [Deltaproteobacteria bacterium]